MHNGRSCGASWRRQPAFAVTRRHMHRNYTQTVECVLNGKCYTENGKCRMQAVACWSDAKPGAVLLCCPPCDRTHVIQDV